MSKPERLPRGIQVVTWKNKSDGSEQIRYRVRINRKDFKADELFEKLKDAKNFLHNSKTKDGIIGLTEREAAVKAVEEAFIETLSNPKLEVYIDRYFAKYMKISDKDRSTIHPTKLRSEQTNRLRLEVLKRTLVEVKPPELQKIGGLTNLYPALSRFAKDKPQMRPLGSLLLSEVTLSVANSYIEQRLKTVAPATVKREVGQIQSIFNKLRHLDEKAPERLHNKQNPWELCDKSLLEGSTKKRYRRLSADEEDKLLRILAGRRNMQALQICTLALSTGMRRGEVLFLKWEQVNDDYIDLTETKNDPRLVPITDDTKSVLETLQRKEQGRLFKYTADGFKTVFFRAVKAAGIKDLRFHDFRREHISRMIALLSNPSAVLIAEMTGMRSVHHIQEEYIEPLEAIKAAKKGVLSNVNELMRAVGHKKQSTTQIYTSLVSVKKSD